MFEKMGWKNRFGTWQAEEIIIDITIITFLLLLGVVISMSKGWITL